MFRFITRARKWLYNSYHTASTSEANQGSVCLSDDTIVIFSNSSQGQLIVRKIKNNVLLNTTIVSLAYNLPIVDTRIEALVDTNNNITVLYVDPNGDLILLYYNYSTDTWSSATRIYNSGVPYISHFSAVMDSNNIVTCVYCTQSISSGYTYYVQAQRISLGTVVNTTTLASGTNRTYSEISVCLDTSNNVHVAWYVEDAVAWNIQYIKYSSNTWNSYANTYSLGFNPSTVYFSPLQTHALRGSNDLTLNINVLGSTIIITFNVILVATNMPEIWYNTNTSGTWGTPTMAYTGLTCATHDAYSIDNILSIVYNTTSGAGFGEGTEVKIGRYISGTWEAAFNVGTIQNTYIRSIVRDKAIIIARQNLNTLKALFYIINNATVSNVSEKTLPSNTWLDDFSVVDNRNRIYFFGSTTTSGAPPVDKFTYTYK